MVRVSSPAKLRPWFKFTATTVMGVVAGLATCFFVVFLAFFQMERKDRVRTSDGSARANGFADSRIDDLEDRNFLK